MKKLIFCASAALVLLASCGKSEVCDCVDEQVSVFKEAKAAKGDQTKLKAIQEKYKDSEAKCKKITEGKSDSEKKKIEDEAKKCDGYAEMDKLMNEELH